MVIALGTLRIPKIINKIFRDKERSEQVIEIIEEVVVKPNTLDTLQNDPRYRYKLRHRIIDYFEKVKTNIRR